MPSLVSNTGTAMYQSQTSAVFNKHAMSIFTTTDLCHVTKYDCHVTSHVINLSFHQVLYD